MRRVQRVFRILEFTLVCSAFLGIARSSSCQDLKGRSPSQLSGVWSMQLFRDDTLPLSPLQRAKATHRGQLALLKVPSSLGRQWLSLSNATHFGVFTLETELFPLPPGILAGLGDKLWSAAARQFDDSIVVVLRPDLSHGALVLSGRFVADTITGDLTVTGYGTHRVGSFTLRPVSQMDDLHAK